MDKRKENLFLEKFRLLNSQEHTEQINWSASSSSDYEDASISDKICNQVIKRQNRKRKRRKVPKNISNLSITILDTSRESNKVIREVNSPVLPPKIHRKSVSLSPILKPAQSFQKGNTASSPILVSRANRLKSPILALKSVSHKSAVKVRKKLFDIDRIEKSVTINENGLTQETNVPIKKQEGNVIESDVISIKSEEIEENDSTHGNMSRAKLDLVKRVRSFFDSHFSSENTSLASQNSISDIVTPKNSTKTSEEIEIFTCKTQVPSNNSSIQSLKQENSANSSESSIYNFSKNSKKIRYRKDGLASRLNNLLKKQNASLSLWQHERFLAANSNFVIPKKEFTVFRIKKVNSKYGCHVLEAVDVNDEMFLILINCCYVSDNICNETVLKLYEPYRIVQYNDSVRLIINVTKFECSIYNS